MAGMVNASEGGITAALATFTSALRYEALPAAAIREVKRALLDFMGCALLGAKHKAVEVLLAHLREMRGLEALQARSGMVVGTVTHKQAPVLRKVYEQMCDPKWEMGFGASATSGGFYQNYAAVAGIDRIVPVDVYVPGCPPRPETVIDAIMQLQDRIAGSKHPIFTDQV